METKKKIYIGGSVMKSLLICAPITSRSGYGAHARDLFRAFYELKRFDIKYWMFAGETALGML